MIKARAEVLMLRFGAAGAFRRLKGARELVLAYHNVIADGTPPAGDRSLHLPRGEFAAHLDLLAKTHAVVPLETLLFSSADDDRPRVAITFDDAYRGAVTLGVQELAARGLPATIFVAPGILGTRALWWDAFGGSAADGRWERERDHAIEQLAGDDARIRRWAREAGLGDSCVPADLRTADEAELHVALASHPLLTFGSHSWSHRNLTRLTSEELDSELRSSFAWLCERFTAVAPLLSYPYGLVSEEVERAAKRAGYRAAFRVAGGHLPQSLGARFALPRLNVPAGVSRAGFELRLAGLFAS